MADKGLLIYGLSETDAHTSRTILSGAIAAEIDIISASANEERFVQDLLESQTVSPVFEEKEIRFVMFLGFDENEIGKALRNFPKLTSPRPIFCTLTENNLSWKIRDLAEHLLEEDRAMKETNRA